MKLSIKNWIQLLFPYLYTAIALYKFNETFWNSLFSGYLIITILYGGYLALSRGQVDVKTGRSFDTDFGKVHEIKKQNFHNYDTSKIGSLIFFLNLFCCIIIMICGVFNGISDNETSKNENKIKDSTTVSDLNTRITTVKRPSKEGSDNSTDSNGKVNIQSEGTNNFSGQNSDGENIINEKTSKSRPVTSTNETTAETIYNISDIDVNPNFPGGMDKFYHFVGNNFKTPEDEGLKGKVIVSFVVEKDGSLSDIKVLKDIGYGTGEEAIRVLKSCPSWNPARKNNNAVRCTFSLPINIQTTE